MKYESPGQKVPTFEAKGIETIRKDQCALTQKVLRNALVTVFRDRGLHGLQEYLFRQWALIHAGRLPVSDFILTGRVRSQYRGKVGPVQAALARRLAEADPGRIVQHKERLAYVIVAAPGRNFKLRDCVLTPNELLTQWDSYTIHAAYYITRHVNAALNRCFGLPPWNINIHNWYDACPKPQKRIHHWPMTRTGGSPMISAFFGSDQCAICGKKCKTDGNAKAVICPNCKGDQGSAVFLAVQTLSSIQQKANKLASLCKNCNGCFENSGTFAVEKKSIQSKKVNSVRLISTKSVSGGLESPLSNCTCIDCPITYKRHEMRESEIEALALCKALRAFDD
jgi:DNA polymerase zeta